jgi:hypothetical protein
MFLEFGLSPSFMDPNMIAISTQVQAPDDFQRVAFDIRHGNRRIACTLTTKFPTKDQAKRYFHANRPLIENWRASRWNWLQPTTVRSSW